MMWSLPLILRRGWLGRLLAEPRVTTMHQCETWHPSDTGFWMLDAGYLLSGFEYL